MLYNPLDRSHNTSTLLAARACQKLLSQDTPAHRRLFSKRPLASCPVVSLGQPQVHGRRACGVGGIWLGFRCRSFSGNVVGAIVCWHWQRPFTFFYCPWGRPSNLPQTHLSHAPCNFSHGKHNAYPGSIPPLPTFTLPFLPKACVRPSFCCCYCTLPRFFLLLTNNVDRRLHGQRPSVYPSPSHQPGPPLVHRLLPALHPLEQLAPHRDGQRPGPFPFAEGKGVGGCQALAC